MKGWENVWIQIDSGAVDSVGPKEIEKALKLQETMISKKGIGFVAAIGSIIQSYGEKRVVGNTDSGEGVSLKVQFVEMCKKKVEKYRGEIKKHKARLEELEMSWGIWRRRRVNLLESSRGVKARRAVQAGGLATPAS